MSASTPDEGIGHGGLAAAVDDAHVLLTTGAGGVGKTTTAAALALAAAFRGRHALVITIDPARRLAQALGLEGLATEPQPVPLDAPGRLDAMMLDMQSTFDDLVDRHAATPDRAAAIKDNRIYQTLSASLSGTQEYMAMEKLHELHDRGTWDLIVVDTPPTRSALDFLDAPARMTSFLEGRLLRLLLQPAMSAGRGYLRAVNFGATAFMKVAGKVTGMGVLDDIADFFRAFDGMYDGFKQRAEEVLALLRRPESRFVVVTSPQPPPLREARFFVDRLEQEGLHLAGVVVNRLHGAPVGHDPAELRRAADLLERSDRDANGPQAVTGATAAGLRLAADLRTIAAREARDVAAALVNRSVPLVVHVGRRSGEIHDLPGLEAIATDLTGPVPD
ncbi:ArsA family ATPase [Salsipaludibacter albus]|uniref:ArsA family ATPase n=1 Tax=Salsipaludibacter albus TaxID=2849650 RepID=UPI001EE40457|nr:ArsA-related P-loop ATPase [Salsipaludibacter albus]MBY5161844.1 AAA family ATPase [Salsipaludibacter albus]